MTASQDKQLQQQQGAARNVPLSLGPEGLSGIGFFIPNFELDNGRQPEQQAGGEPFRPKCAPYFSTLIEAPWGYFGDRKVPVTSNIFAKAFMYLNAHEATWVYHILEHRLILIELGRKYTRLLQEGLSNGRNLYESRVSATQTIINEESTKVSVLNLPDFEYRFNQFDSAIAEALRWQSLLSAFGVPEILLIHYDGRDTDVWDDIPLPDVESVSDVEWRPLHNKLLSPALGLKETCLKLSGVVDMIQQLKGSENKELRTYLVDNIERRVKIVLGSEKDLPDYVPPEDEDEDDDSMADAD
jgi:hypothetical protein